MKTLTKKAQQTLDKYMKKVRSYLQCCPSVNAYEVERDITEHITEALRDSKDPVSYSELKAVLDKLGHPAQWVPVEELPWWRQLELQFQKAMKEYPLVYKALLVFLIVLIAIQIIGRLGLFLLILLFLGLLFKKKQLL